MIGILFFKNGVPMNLEVPPDKQVARLLQEHTTEIQCVPAGEHNITPRNFHFRHFDYTLSVQENGNGTLYLSTRHRDVVTRELTAKGMSRPSAGDKAFRFPHDLDQFMIAGPNDERRLVFWGVVVHLPGRTL